MTDAAFSIAAERSRPAKYDDMTGSGPPVLGTPYPDGVAHAVQAGSKTTRCGRPLTRLVEFPSLDFGHTFLRDRCHACKRGLGGVSAWSSGDFMYDETYQGIGRSYSYDWCRFRRMSQCWHSGELNEPASHEAGYAVWIPINQGHCPRVKWTAQQKCPIGAPGSNIDGGFVDATVAWEDGGQRGGVPSETYSADEVARWGREDVHGQATARNSPAPSSGQAKELTESAEDPVAQLERLAELRRQGVITEEEFSAMKAKVIEG